MQSVAMPGNSRRTDEVKYMRLPAKQSKSLSQSVFLQNYSAICVFWQAALLRLNSVLRNAHEYCCKLERDIARMPGIRTG